MKKLAYLFIGLLIGFLACKYLFNQSLTDNNMGIIKPRGVISPKKAKELDQNFNARHAVISKEIGVADNRSSWYSLEDLENYLAYAKNQADSLGYKMDGIRVYAGAHGEKGLTTMFLVPTSNSKIQKGSTSPFGIMTQGGSGDIGGADPLNGGGDGNPPSHNYPQ